MKSLYLHVAFTIEVGLASTILQAQSSFELKPRADLLFEERVDLKISLNDENEPFPNCDAVAKEMETAKKLVDRCEAFDPITFSENQVFCDIAYERLNIAEYGYHNWQLMDPYLIRDESVSYRIDVNDELAEKIERSFKEDLNESQNLDYVSISPRIQNMRFESTGEDPDFRYIFNLKYFGPKIKELVTFSDTGAFSIFGRSLNCNLVAGKGIFNGYLELSASIIDIPTFEHMTVYWKLYQDLKALDFHPSWNEKERKFYLASFITERLQELPIKPYAFYKAVRGNSSLDVKSLDYDYELRNLFISQYGIAKTLNVKGIF